MNSKQIQINFDGDFRQVVLKLANTYQPKEVPEDFKANNLSEFIQVMSIAMANDFSSQLQPLLAQKIHEVIQKQLP